VGGEFESLFLGNRLPFKDLTLSVKFFLPLEKILNHLFIYADYNCGKTVLAKIIAEECGLKNIPSLFIDIKGDIASLAFYLDEEKINSSSYFASFKEKLKFNQEQLEKFGLKEDFIFRLKEKVKVAIFTPYSNEGIPLIFPLLPEIPQEDEKFKFFSDFFSDLITNHLYPQKECKEEKEFLSQLISYAGERFDFKKREGIIEFLEVLQNPPQEIKASLENKQEFVQKLGKFLLEKKKKIKEIGAPLDLDLLTGKYFGDKSYISVISFTNLENFDRKFILSHIIYEIYKWMKKNKASFNLVFCIDRIEEIKDKKISHLLDFFLREARNYGVSCLLVANQFNEDDYEWIKKCRIWAIGKLEEERKKKFLEEVKKMNTEFKDLPTLLDFPRSCEFLLKLSQEVILFKERWLGSFHKVIESPLYSSLMEEEVKSNFRAFYIGEEKEVTSTQQILIPEVIFEKFQFGKEIAPFVLDKEPEEAIKLLLEELARENILPFEIQFKNVQLIIARTAVAQWKVDFLHHDPLGRVTQHIKEEGIYSKVNIPVVVERDTREKVVNLVDKEVHPRWEEISKKVSLIRPAPVKINRWEVLNHISEKIGVRVKNAHIVTKEKDIAVGWKFLLQFRGKILEAFVDIITQEVKIKYPLLKEEEIIEEIKKEYPHLKIDKKDIKEGLFFYTVSYQDKDQLYLLRISKKSGRILTEKRLLTEKKAYQIAKEITQEEPFMVKKFKGAWHFYYSSGLLIIVDEETGEAVTKEIVSSDEVERLAYREILKILKEKEGKFSLVKKEFKEGKWFLNFVSFQWDIRITVDEEGKMTHTSQLQKAYCLEEAKKLLAEYGISVSAERGVNSWKNGWEFDFLSPLGYFTVRITDKERKLIKRRLTPEGIEHFINFKLKGKIVSLKDKQAFWEIIFKRNNKVYLLEVDKINSNIRNVKIKRGIFWKKTDEKISF